jgi:hypothetical protein
MDLTPYSYRKTLLDKTNVLMGNTSSYLFLSICTVDCYDYYEIIKWEESGNNQLRLHLR